jgi:ribonuclease I
MNEVEVVARAVAPMMEGGREFDQMPPTRLELRQWSRSGMCSTNDATQDDATELAQAAIAALDAAAAIPTLRARIAEDQAQIAALTTYRENLRDEVIELRARIAELEAFQQ